MMHTLDTTTAKWYKVYSMGRERHPLQPGLQRSGQALGDRIRLARLRRHMSQVEVAARADVDRLTLARLERGDLTVSLALLVRVLSILGLAGDLENIAKDDVLGRQLQDLPLQRPLQRYRKEG
jgi:transcriptional regulator with XRE-family HTH domain